MLDLLLINNIGRMHRSDTEAGANPLFEKNDALQMLVEASTVALIGVA